jgi:effector-binding domain-containing protein
MSTECQLVEWPLQQTLSARVRTPVEELPQHFGRVYGALFQYLAELGEPPAGEPFAIYYNMDMKALDVEIGVAVTKVLPARGELQPGAISAGRFVTIEFTGPYDALGLAYEALTAFAEAQGVEPSGVAHDTTQRPQPGAARGAAHRFSWHRRAPGCGVVLHRADKTPASTLHRRPGC